MVQNAMRVEKDFEELLKLFDKYKVRYCIVGSFAVGFHAIPRYTKDIDFLVEPSDKNAKNVLKALKEFGFEGLQLGVLDFSREGMVVQLGYEPVRIDLITSIGGCKFKEVWENKAKGTYGEAKAFFIGLDELIKSKLAAGRKQDKADMDILAAAKKRKK